MPLTQSEHDRSEETLVVGVAGHGPCTWQLRVCGIVHGEGVEPSSDEALIAAAFRLRDEADKAVGQ